MFLQRRGEPAPRHELIGPSLESAPWRGLARHPGCEQYGKVTDVMPSPTVDLAQRAADPSHRRDTPRDGQVVDQVLEARSAEDAREIDDCSLDGRRRDAGHLGEVVGVEIAVPVDSDSPMRVAGRRTFDRHRHDEGDPIDTTEPQGRLVTGDASRYLQNTRPDHRSVGGHDARDPEDVRKQMGQRPALRRADQLPTSDAELLGLRDREHAVLRCRECSDRSHPARSHPDEYSASL
jgi:hypothetical protein